MIGTRYGKVKIVDYQSSWAEEFQREKELLMETLSTDVILIEHIGSTSIKNMAAKPTLDIMVGLNRLKSSTHYQPLLETIGYQFRQKHPVPGRFHFAKISQGFRTHNVSLTQYKSEFWDNHLLFRNYLSLNPEVAKEYEILKHKLAKSFSDDTIRYTNGKNEFIERILQEAKKNHDK